MSLNSLFRNSLEHLENAVLDPIERAGLETFEIEFYDRATRRPKTERHIALFKRTCFQNSVFLRLVQNSVKSSYRAVG